MADTKELILKTRTLLRGVTRLIFLLETAEHPSLIIMGERERWEQVLDELMNVNDVLVANKSGMRTIARLERVCTDAGTAAELAKLSDARIRRETMAQGYAEEFLAHYEGEIAEAVKYLHFSALAPYAGAVSTVGLYDLLSERTGVTISPKGEFALIVTDDDGEGRHNADGTPVSLEQLLHELQTDPELRPLFSEQAALRRRYGRSRPKGKSARFFRIIDGQADTPEENR